MSADHLREHPGVKMPYFPLPKPTFPQRWKCVQLQIPDHESWELLFREALRTLYGRWFNWERDAGKNGRKIAKVWQHIESTITDCGNSGDGAGENDDCCEPDSDILDAFDIDSFEDLAQMYLNTAPFIGQIVIAIAPPTSLGWLKLDGSVVNKADYPQLFDLLAAYVSHDDTTFVLPNFGSRVPMGAEEGGLVGSVLQLNGTAEINLTSDQLPPHHHDIPPHTHTTNPHNHDQDPHNHALTDPGHTHTTNIKQTSAAGAQSRVMTSNNSGTDGTLATSSQTTGISITDKTATNKPATVAVNASTTYLSGETGSNDPISILNPVIGVYYFIYAGINHLSQGC